MREMKWWREGEEEGVIASPTPSPSFPFTQLKRLPRKLHDYQDSPL